MPFAVMLTFLTPFSFAAETPFNPTHGGHHEVLGSAIGCRTDVFARRFNLMRDVASLVSTSQALVAHYIVRQRT